MSAAGYYKTNYRALRLREMVRWFGVKKGVRNYWITRFMPPGSGAWMPGLWLENECKREDLSEAFWHATKPHRTNFEQLGLTECRLSKPKTLSPNVRESGGVSYLDPTGCYFGQLLYHYLCNARTGREKIEMVIAFTAVFEPVRFIYTNAKKTFDPPDDTKIVRLNSCDVNFIFNEFQQGLQRRKESPRRFEDVESLRQWFDAWQTQAFEDRVRRRLFVPMTDQEVARARERLQNSVAAAPLVRSRGFNFRWALWLVIIGCIFALELARHQIPYGRDHGRPDTFEYQGQEFKMRKAYPTYEDYKDDPNNLDTNELDRIEQVMTSAQVPQSFENKDDLSRFLIVDLKFPGYGMGGIGEQVKADDGSRLLVETVEIPQREKDRVLTLRQSGEEFELVDDFVYSTATNGIRHAKLEKQVLRYYDANNQIIREKQL